ncbi:hypothetical protein QJQ45_022311 [Haematococcus lacustris]|nr:hypothetical protein QJQ45_022311 [Haematococcus lacustris]
MHPALVRFQTSTMQLSSIQRLACGRPRPYICAQKQWQCTSEKTTAVVTQTEEAKVNAAIATARPSHTSADPEGVRPTPQVKATLSSLDALLGDAAKASFDSVMAFEGLAPEIVNGRAAMLGFMFAISNELSSGESVYAQLIGGGAARMLVLIALVVAASFAPALRGVRQALPVHPQQHPVPPTAAATAATAAAAGEHSIGLTQRVPMAEVFNKEPKKQKAWGPFAPDAELINGRAAMVGIATIILLEGTSGTAFFL